MSFLIGRMTAGLFGGLLMALSGGVFVTFSVSGSDWDGVVAGALVTLALWIIGMLLSFTASCGRAAWGRIGAMILFFMIGSALLYQ